MSDASFDLALALECVDPSWTPLFDSQRHELETLFVELEKRRAVESLAPVVTNIFRVFETPLEDLRVLILGQDPYPTPGIAIGRAFAVDSTVSMPASLRNIEKELHRSFTTDFSLDPTLQSWVDQGVFLLNTALTIDTSQSQFGHFDLWESFTQATLNFISQNSSDLVWLLWGKEAAKYASFADSSLTIKTSHPSPLSAYRGFSGSDIFVECNAKLVDNGYLAIEWLTR